MIFSQKNFINVGFLRLFRAARLVKLLRFSKTSNIINYLGQLQISLNDHGPWLWPSSILHPIVKIIHPSPPPGKATPSESFCGPSFSLSRSVNFDKKSRFCHPVLHDFYHYPSSSFSPSSSSSWAEKIFLPPSIVCLISKVLAFQGLFTTCHTHSPPPASLSIFPGNLIKRFDRIIWWIIW